MRETEANRRLVKELNQIPRAKFILKEARKVRGHPDIMGCINGLTVVIECKKPARVDAKGSKLQKKELDDWQKAGAVPIYAVGEEGYAAALETVKQFSRDIIAMENKITRPVQ